MRSKNLSLGQYMGGKYFYRNWILQHLPRRNFTCFAEVFGGMAHVLFGLPERLCTIEVYNDKWNDIVNLFEQIRDNYEGLMKEIRLPYSRNLFQKFGKKFKERDFKNDVERAAIIFYLNHCSFNGKFGEHFRISPIRETSITWKSKVKRMAQLTDRLQDIVIEELDFRDLIKKYDGPGTIFYCDPPYIGTEDYYTPVFTEKDHKDLAQLLNNIQGKAMVSYYDHPTLDELYPSRSWDRQFKEGVKMATHSKGEKKIKSMELLLLNYKSKRDFNKANLDNLL